MELGRATDSLRNISRGNGLHGSRFSLGLKRGAGAAFSPTKASKPFNKFEVDDLGGALNRDGSLIFLRDLRNVV